MTSESETPSDLHPDPLPVDPNVRVPKAIQKEIDVANAYFEPHTKFTFEFGVPVLFTVHCSVNNILSRITDGIEDAIKVILAQHDLRPLPGRITIEAIPTKQKEVTHGE